MYLQQLEITGFKSFAAKTVLKFPAPTGGRGGITAIVGPNGAGKSCLAESIRWAMGEQSLKALRGKRAEDVIFSGSATRARLGLAAVSLALNNEDRAMPVDYPEVVLTRRVDRSGVGEYLLNRTPIRLTDAVLLMAKANFGQKSYSVIGQGMVDDILNSTPQERKSFFEEAAGVKQYQLKREQSVRKLVHTWENVKQAEAVVEEIAPRLRSLSRQVKKLQQREALTQELAALQREFYGRAWRELAGERQKLEPELDRLQRGFAAGTEELQAVQRQLTRLEQEDRRTEVFNRLQQRYQRSVEAKGKLRESELRLRSTIELAAVKATLVATPLPLPEIVGRLKRLGTAYDEFLTQLAAARNAGALDALRQRAVQLRDEIVALTRELEHPSGKPAAGSDPKLQAELARVQQELGQAAAAVTAAQREFNQFNASEEAKRGRFFELQRQFQDQQQRLNGMAAQLAELRVAVAKLDTRRDTLLTEVAAELKATDWLPQFVPAGGADVPQMHAEITQLKRQLEFVGGIEPETVAEHTQTKERYDFITSQVNDLRQSLTRLRSVIEELDSTIHRQFHDAFRTINQAFSRYFKVLFSGGRAEIVALTQDVAEVEERQHVEAAAEGVAVTAEEADPEATELQRWLKGTGGKVVVGVEIKATPPGKKVAAVQMLSGGERAMTSIALISAIIASNPSPFVVLDEVDAALDEANSERFGAILDELSGKTQFIVITHNRATMHRAAVLYGVTMGDDGVSRILSLKLEEGEKLVNR